MTTASASGMPYSYCLGLQGALPASRAQLGCTGRPPPVVTWLEQPTVGVVNTLEGLVVQDDTTDSAV